MIWGETATNARLARLAALGLGCLALGACNQTASRVDPKWGVSASARVVEPGQPVPKGGGVYRVGKPYVVAGKTYVPEHDPNYTVTGLASWYGDDFHGRYTANGEVFDKESISAAHPTLPLPSYVRVTNMANRKSIIVRVNDRGPYVGNRVIDLSVKTASLLGFQGHGVAKVKVDYVGRAPLQGSDDRKLVATLREGAPAHAPVQVASAGGFAPYFDSRPLAAIKDVPTPPERPYRMDEAAVEVAEAEPAPRTFELAANARTAQAVMQDDPRHAAPAAPSTGRLSSPVSAYAPARYDGAVGLLSGRGLY